MIKEIERFVDNSKFAANLSETITPILVEHLQKFSSRTNRPKCIFSEYGSDQELRIKEIFKKFNTLKDSLKTISIIPYFLQTSLIEQICKENHLEEIEYYQYHYENFLIRLVGIPDICAKIGNLVYQTGIEEKKCNWYKFMNHPEIKREDCSSKLEDLSNLLSSLRSDRHIIVHSGGFQSEQIKSIESNIIDDELIPIDKILLDWFKNDKKEEIERLTNFMKGHLNQTLKHVFEFLDSMETKI